MTAAVSAKETRTNPASLLPASCWLSGVVSILSSTEMETEINEREGVRQWERGRQGARASEAAK